MFGYACRFNLILHVQLMWFQYPKSQQPKIIVSYIYVNIQPYLYRHKCHVKHVNAVSNLLSITLQYSWDMVWLDNRRKRFHYDNSCDPFIIIIDFMTFGSGPCGNCIDRQINGFPYGNNPIHVQNMSWPHGKFSKIFEIYVGYPRSLPMQYSKILLIEMCIQLSNLTAR